MKCIISSLSALPAMPERMPGRSPKTSSERLSGGASMERVCRFRASLPPIQSAVSVSFMLLRGVAFQVTVEVDVAEGDD